MSIRTALRASLTLLALGGLGSSVSALASGCTQGAEFERVTDLVGPSYAQFKDRGVSNFIEVRCGTLDCHGQLGRPMRIYSGRGLRLPGDAGPVVSGGLGTTPAERLENYLAVVGLEPERTQRVADEGGANPERLLLINKPRDDVKHKGGAVLERGDDGDVCLTTWLAEDADKAACDRAAAYP